MATTCQYQVSDADLAAFQRDGAVCLRGVTDATWLERLRIAIDRNKEPDDWYFHYIYMWQRDPDLRDFVFHSALPEAASQLMGTEKVNLVYDQIFAKEEVSEERTEWHNDQPFWPVRGPAMSIWLAVDEVSEDTGALEFIRGSHRWKRWFEITGPNLPLEVSPKFEEIPDYEATRDEHEILSWNLEPGDAVAFHALCVHGAYPFRRSGIRRRAYSLRFAAGEAVYAEPSFALPRFCNPLLQEGQPLDSDMYPVVYESRVSD